MHQYCIVPYKENGSHLSVRTALVYELWNLLWFFLLVPPFEWEKLILLITDDLWSGVFSKGFLSYNTGLLLSLKADLYIPYSCATVMLSYYVDEAFDVLCDNVWSEFESISPMSLCTSSIVWNFTSKLNTPLCITLGMSLASIYPNGLARLLLISLVISTSLCYFCSSSMEKNNSSVSFLKKYYFPCESSSYC